MLTNCQVLADARGFRSEILSREALHFLTLLHHRFEFSRRKLLQRRKQVVENLRAGGELKPLTQTEWLRISDWQIATPPADLQDRRVEITGPTDAKMMINALNSGAKVFMADLEDSLSPTWDGVIDGQINLYKAVRRQLNFVSADGKNYDLLPKMATLVVRPRGWHLTEEHVTVDGLPISASLFDFGLYFYHNAQALLERGTGPYFYLPKLESHLEARLWNDVFLYAQESLGIAPGTIRATVLIETIPAAFEMEEILYELREHIAGLNAGRWDYLFSMIKKFSHRRDLIFPDRSQLTMNIPYMRAYTKTLVDVCHRRGAHAIGGMAAFIPSRRDQEINERAFAKVREDKLREATDGFDGTWVAHPDLVPIARQIFDDVLAEGPHQKHRRPTHVPAAKDLLPSNLEDGKVTLNGVINNISVSLQYLDAWLRGIGAVGIFNLMEDAATAEISRSELWQWLHHGVRTAEGDLIDADFFMRYLNATVYELGGTQKGRLKEAAGLLAHLVLNEEFTEFLTVPAYQLLVGGPKYADRPTETRLEN